MLNCHFIALKAKARKGLFAGHARVGDMAEALPLIHIGQVHLHRRNAHRLQRVQYCHTGVGIGGGIDDNTVRIAVGRLDFINDVPLVV